MSRFIELDEPAELWLLVHRDSDYTLPFTFKESKTGPAIDLTGYTFECAFLPTAGDAPLQQPTVSVDDAAAGEISIALTRTATASVVTMPTDHVWRLWWTNPSGKRSLKIEGRVRMEDV